VAGTGSVLVGAEHPTIDSDRPVGAFVGIGVAAQLLEDPDPGAIS